MIFDGQNFSVNKVGKWHDSKTKDMDMINFTATEKIPRIYSTVEHFGQGILILFCCIIIGEWVVGLNGTLNYCRQSKHAHH